MTKAVRRTDGQTVGRTFTRLSMGLLGLSLTVWPSGLLAAQQYPTTPPAPMPLRPVRFPRFVGTRMANGLSLVIVENHEQPVVSLNLSVAAGNRYEPADKTGLADLAAEVLTKGTARRTADQLAAEVEGAGGSISASAGPDFLTISLSGLAENVQQLADILGDVARHPEFPQGEVDLARTRMISALRAELAEPASIANRIFRREVYGDHPYGRSETDATLRGLTREDVTRFYAERVTPQGALLVVAGDVDPAAVTRLVARSLGEWTGRSAAALPVAAPTPRARTEIVLVHKPGAVQSNIVAGFTFIRPTDPNLYPLAVANQVLGGGPDSRLFLILREQKGWTYGSYSRFTRTLDVGRFEATAEVRTEVTDSALAELLRQLERVRSEVPADSEITNARNFIVGSFPLTIETPDQVAGQVASARLLGLGDDYVVRYRERIAAVTRAQIAAASRRFLTTDRMVIVVVGDGPRILDGLKAQGLPLRIVDVEGRPLSEEDLRPRATAVRWETARITAGTATYRVMVQGTAFGEENRVVSRSDAGGRTVWQMITTTNIGPMVRQSDTTLVDAATLAPIRVRVGGTIAGTEVAVRLDYEAGRVRGQSRAPRGPGQPPQERTVDTTVTAGTLDESEMALALVALPLAADARWSVPVFAGSEAAFRTYTIAVTGQESVTVPAGTFNCWKVDVSGSEVPVTFWVSRDAPATIVRLELSGTPLAFELTQRN